MVKVYRTRCIIRRNGTEYKKGSIIEGLTDKEIEQGLENHWLEAVGEKEDSTDDSKTSSTDKPDNKSQKITRAELIEEAKLLGLAFTKKSTDEEIKQAIKEANAKIREGLITKAAEFNLEVTDEMTNKEIEQLIIAIEGGARE